jgi:hypothetical protein
MTPERFEKIKPFATIIPREGEHQHRSKEVLMALSAGQDAADAGKWRLRRRSDHRIQEGQPFRTPGHRQREPRLEGPLQQDEVPDLIDVKGTAFRVRSTGNVSGTYRTIDAVGLRFGNDIQWRYWRLE